MLFERINDECLRHKQIPCAIFILHQPERKIQTQLAHTSLTSFLPKLVLKPTSFVKCHITTQPKTHVHGSGTRSGTKTMNVSYLLAQNSLCVDLVVFDYINTSLMSVHCSLDGDYWRL